MDRQEKELLALLIKDPEQGMSQIIDQYGGAVKTICQNILRNSNSALIEDCIQESFIHLWMHVSQRKKIHTSLKAFLYQITRNCALNTLKKYQLQACVSTEEFDGYGLEQLLGAELVVSTEDEFERRYTYQMVHEAVEEMEEPDRKIFLLKFFYYYNVREISEILKLKEDNVESKIRRGKKKLQKKFFEGGMA